MKLLFLTFFLTKHYILAFYDIISSKILMLKLELLFLCRSLEKVAGNGQC